MNRLLFLSTITILTSCANAKPGTGATEKELYKNWVLSRCLNYAFPNDSINQDALNSASAYLEQSKLPVEAFVAADPLIKELLQKSTQGSIPGSFKVKSCVDLSNSPELEKLFNEQKHKK